jgi:hypothetical protein
MITYGNALYSMLCTILSLTSLYLCEGSGAAVQGKEWDYIYWGSYFDATGFTIRPVLVFDDLDISTTLIGNVISIGYG